MDKYYLSAKALYAIFKEKGVENLYHANTVQTSLTFIDKRALLSRAYVANNGLIQTPQKSDNEDKVYNVWDDVFLDGIDLHNKYSRANKYGPILFVLKIDLLTSQYISEVLIPKNNPWYWKPNENWDDRYYSNIEDVKRDYLTGKSLDSRIMFTFRSPETTIKLNKYLKHIIIDKPKIFISFKSEGQKNIGDFTLEKISESLKRNGLGHISVAHRHDSGIFNRCVCHTEYTVLFNTNSNEFKKRFLATV